MPAPTLIPERVTAAKAGDLIVGATLHTTRDRALEHAEALRKVVHETGRPGVTIKMLERTVKAHGALITVWAVPRVRLWYTPKGGAIRVEVAERDDLELVVMPARW